MTSKRAMDAAAAIYESFEGVWTDDADVVANNKQALAEALEAYALQEREAKDAAYRERNLCVSVIAKMAIALGWDAWLGKHVGGEWDEEWRSIVFIQTPEGQISWHLHDSEVGYFAGLPQKDIPWDGHDTPEKYRRAQSAANRAKWGI